jgi:hypothetical protein
MVFTSPVRDEFVCAGHTLPEVPGSCRKSLPNWNGKVAANYDTGRFALVPALKAAITWSRLSDSISR